MRKAKKPIFFKGGNAFLPGFQRSFNMRSRQVMTCIWTWWLLLPRLDTIPIGWCRDLVCLCLSTLLHLWTDTCSIFFVASRIALPNSPGVAFWGALQQTRPVKGRDGRERHSTRREAAVPMHGVAAWRNFRTGRNCLRFGKRLSRRDATMMGRRHLRYMRSAVIHP